MSGATSGHRRPGRPAASSAVSGRQALLDATLELLGESGAQLTLREVAERAGVRSTLVHYHFGSRDELLSAALERISGQVREQLGAAAALEGGAETRLKAIVRQVVRIFGAHPYLPRLAIEQVLAPDHRSADRFAAEIAGPNVRLLADVLARGSASGELRRVDPHHCIPMIMGTCAWFFLAAPLVERLFGLSPGDPDTAEAFAEHAADFVWRALSTEAEA